MKFEELYSRAVDWATEAHKNQKYGKHPYTHHLKDVQAVLSRFGYGPDLNDRAKRLTIAAWLHDIIEDTSVTYNDVKREMGQEIADLVYCVTNEPGANRKERHAKTYPKIKGYPDGDGIILKLADRIANTEASIREFFTSDLFSMYYKEWANFCVMLRTDGVATEMWEYLDGLMTNPKFAFTEAIKNTSFNSEGAKAEAEEIGSALDLDMLTWERLFEYKKKKKSS